MKNGPLKDVFPIEKWWFSSQPCKFTRGYPTSFPYKKTVCGNTPDPCHHTTIPFRPTVLVGFQVLAAQRIQAAQRGRQQRRQRAAVEVAARKPWGIFHGKFLRRISVRSFCFKGILKIHGILNVCETFGENRWLWFLGRTVWNALDIF